MEQIHQIHREEQPRMGLVVHFIPVLSGVVVLATTLANAVLVASGTPLLVACLLCIIPAGASFALARLTQKQAQSTQRSLLTTIIATCQAVLEGQGAVRMQLSTAGQEQEAQQLCRTINLLLDHYTYMERDVQQRKQELSRLYDQMEQLAYEIKPVIDGDLRARSTIAEGILGSIATRCNELIEDTAQLIQWAQSMSDQIIRISHSLIGSSVDIAQMMDALIKQHEATTNAVETLVAFTIRTESSLFSSIEVLQGSWDLLQQHQRVSDGAASPPPPGMALEPFQDMPQQIKLLKDLLKETRETTRLAEQSITDLHEIAQRVPLVNGIVVQFASMISSLATLANHWRHVADNYELPASSEEVRLFVEAEQTPLLALDRRN